MERVLIVLTAVLLAGCLGPAKDTAPDTVIPMDDLTLRSSAFEDGGAIPAMYTCDGQDINPPLEIMNVPETAETLVLLVDDPDAMEPAGKVWDHWTVWNIDSDTTIIDEDSVPGDAVQGRTDFGHNQYGGPCPPDGEHTYRFRLYALDTSLNLSPDSTKADVENAIEGHVVEETVLEGRYDRQ